MVSYNKDEGSDHMAKVATSLTLDADVKKEAQELFSDLGLDLSTAVGIFLRQSVREQRIPFDVKRETPNAETVAAIQEVKDMEAHPERYKGYSSFGELMKEVAADA